MSPFERVLLYASAVAAAGTGGVYIWMKWLLPATDPFSIVHHPWQPSVLSWHVLVAPFLVFALGLITREHIIGRFLEGRPRRGRATGVLAVVPAAAMIVTGYLTQVLTDAAARKAMGIAHAASGALFTLLFLAHLVAARPGRRAANGAASARGAAGGTAGIGLALLRLDRLGRRGIESFPRSRTAQAPTGGRRP
ncbi:MAG: hypothetical protein DMF50_07575 [Acidobacteria bacterium]|nr:MAG: hypothetical protein DMF50_07575 [Acidobacteriota bacterium]